MGYYQMDKIRFDRHSGGKSNMQMRMKAELLIFVPDWLREGDNPSRVDGALLKTCKTL